MRRLLVVVEDAHWLDRPTADVLAFVARRIESDPIVLLAAARDGYASVLADAGLPEHRARRPRRRDGRRVARRVGPAPSARGCARGCCARRPATRSRCSSCRRRGAGTSDEQSVPGGLPLTERLERAFAGRVADLPEPTRARPARRRAQRRGRPRRDPPGGRRASPDAAWISTRSRPRPRRASSTLDLQSLRFRHPLMRSAVAQSASLAERRRAHEALATLLDDQPDRRAWHRAALLTGEHEDVALELEAAGARARRRGALAVAVTAMRRAAELGEPGSRSRRLLAAAGLAVELGRPDVVEPLLREVEQLRLGELERARVTWVEETALTRPLGDAERFTSLIAAAERAGAAGDHELHVDLLWLVASRAWWVDPGPEARQA